LALEESAAHALEVLNTLLAAADNGRAQLLELRDRMVAATEGVDNDWVLLRERARSFLEQAAGQEHQLIALKAEAARAGEALREKLDHLDDETTADARATHVEIDTLATATEETGERLQGVLQHAEEAEQGLEQGLRDVEAELATAMAEADDLLRGTLARELKEMEEEVERAAIELSAYFSGQCVPAMEQKAYDLSSFLAAAEESVRHTLEASLESNEGAAESVLRECLGTYGDTMHDLGRLAGSLEEAIDNLRDFVEDGQERLDDRKDRWDAAVRRGRDGLRDALESLHAVEHYLSRYTFGH
jgi:hypothetical protein